MRPKFALHWLVAISYMILFFGTIIPILIADMPHNSSISECVAHGLPRVIFTVAVLGTFPLVTIILIAFAYWCIHHKNTNSKCFTVFIIVQCVIGVVGMFALCGLALFTTVEYHDVHIACATAFFGLMYAHLTMSVCIPFIDGNPVVCDRESGWHILRACTFFTGGCIVIGAYTSMIHSNWTFSNFEWIYLAAFTTYLFTFWNEMSNRVFEPCCRHFITPINNIPYDVDNGREMDGRVF